MRRSACCCSIIRNSEKKLQLTACSASSIRVVGSSNCWKESLKRKTCRLAASVRSLAQHGQTNSSQATPQWRAVLDNGQAGLKVSLPVVSFLVAACQQMKTNDKRVMSSLPLRRTLRKQLHCNSPCASMIPVALESFLLLLGLASAKGTLAWQAPAGQNRGRAQRQIALGDSQPRLVCVLCDRHNTASDGSHVPWGKYKYRAEHDHRVRVACGKKCGGCRLFAPGLTYVT